MQEKYPRISIMMPVLNMASTVEKALQSVIDQNYPNTEILVMDAASTDGTVEILNKFRDKISYFRSHKDNGNCESLNEALQNATGDIINQLGADDWYEPNTFFKVAEAFMSDPDLDIVNVLSRRISNDEEGNPVVRLITTQDIMNISNGNVQVLDPNCRFFKIDLFKKLGPIIGMVDGKMAVASDYEYIHRFSLYNPKNITLNHIGYNYFGHENSLTFNTNKYTKLKIYDQKVFYLEQLLTKHSHMMSESLKASYEKEYRIAYTRRVVRNFVDGDFKKAFFNLKIGLKKFGLLFPFKVLRYYISYFLRVNKVIRSLKQK